MNAGRSRSSAIPLDLVLVLLYLAAVVGLLAADALGARSSPTRILLTLPLLVFVPGYALGAAAFPRAPARERRGSLLDRVRERPGGVDTTERVALGLGLSLALLPIVGVLVAFQPGPFTTEASVVALAGVGALFSLIAAIRRWRLPAEERYGPPLGYWRDVVGRSTEGSGTDALLSVGLGLSVVLAVVAGGFAIAAPIDAQQFTTLAAGHMNSQGEFVASPSDRMLENISTGSSVESAFYVKNQEQRTVEYTVVVQVQRVNDQGELRQVSELNRYRQTLEPGQEWIQPHDVTLRLQGMNVRIAYLLFKGPVPAGASTENAELFTFHAVNVTSGGG